MKIRDFKKYANSHSRNDESPKLKLKQVKRQIKFKIQQQRKDKTKYTH